MGIGGSGASAAAAIAQSQGYRVSGCDKEPFNEFTENIPKNDIHPGHNPNHLENIDILAITPAVTSLDPKNSELLEAKKRKIPIITWQKFLGKNLMQGYFVIAVCGTHGKSTTTAMIATMLEDAGLDPTVAFGAIMPRWGKNYRIGRSKFFVVEADEYNDNFLSIVPDIAVVTNIEMDHPEYFENFEAVKKSFTKFLSTAKSRIVADLEDIGIRDVLGAGTFHLPGGIEDYSKKPIDFQLKIPGRFNILNASAAYRVGIALGIKPKVIKNSLGNFTGAGRRFEYMGKYRSAAIYSDFGHHPTEIKVTIQAAKEKFKKRRLFVVFQPHMFSRTYALFDDFVNVLRAIPAEKIYIIDIYPSREVDTSLVNSQKLVEAVNDPKVVYTPTGNDALTAVKKDIKKDDVVFFLGAGDTHKFAKDLIQDAKI